MMMTMSKAVAERVANAKTHNPAWDEFEYCMDCLTTNIYIAPCPKA